MAPDAAGRRARREFGSVALIEEQGRDVWRFRLIENALDDLRQAARKTTHVSGFSISVTLTLAVGIGATTAVYSLIDAVFFKPLPFAEADRLVRVRTAVPVDTPRPDALSRPVDITDLMAMLEVFRGVAAYATGGLNLGAAPLEAARIQATYVTSGFFPLLGIGPSLGRLFIKNDAASSAPPTTILSDRLWRGAFGGNPSVIGTTITLNGVVHEVVGVMPAAFAFPSAAQVWVPLPIPFPPQRIVENTRQTDVTPSARPSRVT